MRVVVRKGSPGLALALALLAVFGCSTSVLPEADAGPDAGTDAGPDAGADAGPDAGPITAAHWCDLPGAVDGGVVPAGFCLRRFAQVLTPRTLAFAPNGDLFVGSPRAQTPGGAPAGLGGIYVLSDDNRDGLADESRVYYSSINAATLHGIALGNGALYYTLLGGVYSVPYASGDRALASTVTPALVADLSDPGASDRFTHTLDFDASGTLYVTRGQYDNNTCPPPNLHGGAVLRIGPGHDLHGDVVSSGLRDPLYLRCGSWPACTGAGCVTSACDVNEMSGDGWAGLGGEEKLIDLHTGDDFGYPCCIALNVPNPQASSTPDCSHTSALAATFALHDSPFGLDWDTGQSFPAPWTGGLFIGFHGAFGSWLHTSLRWAPVDPVTHQPSGAFHDFVTGWGYQGPVVGRIADVRFSPDGRLFFSDDQAGAIYWVAPTGMLRPQ